MHENFKNERWKTKLTTYVTFSFLSFISLYIISVSRPDLVQGLNYGAALWRAIHIPEQQ